MKGINMWLGLLLVAVTPIQALKVTPGSDCAALCSDGSSKTESDTSASSTNTTDIVCGDDDFASTGKGIKFRNCAKCLQDSKATSDSESDVYWLLYNLRYAFDVCIFSFPKAGAAGTVSSPCNIDGACAALRYPLESSLLDYDSGNKFDYCEANNSIINGNSYRACTRCLQSTSSQTYLSNFLISLKAGCDQRPEAGGVLGITGEIFSSEKVNSTQSDEDEKLPGDGGAKTGAMTTGTIVGIAVGCGLVVIGGICLMIVHCRRQRRYNGEKIASPEPEDPSPLGPITTLHKGPHFTSHEMSQSIGSYNPDKHGHNRTMSNAEYYQQIEQDMQDGVVGGVNYHFAPNSKSNGPGGALPAHPAYKPRVMSRNSTRSQSPPNPPGPPKANIPDSYALRTYLKAAEDSGVHPNDIPRTLDGHHSRSSSSQSRHPSPPRQAAMAANIQKQPPPPPPARAPTHSRIPSLVLPSVPKIKIPKKYTPPQVVIQDATPVSTMNEGNELRISRPLAVLDSRFQDRPLGGGQQVMATEAPAGFNDDAYMRRGGANASPMPSGSSSRLYG